MTTATTPDTVSPSTDTAPALTPATADTPVLSILALVSALVGIVFGLAIPLSIVAVVLGILGLQREPRGRTMSIWSIVLGAVPFAFGALAAIVGLTLVVPFGLFWAFGGF